MADQRTVPNNQMKTTPSKRGLARSSVSLLPVPKKMAAVARPIKSGYSERMKPINLFLLGTKGLAGGGADICSRLSSTATRRNRQMRVRAVLVFKAHPPGRYGACRQHEPGGSISPRANPGAELTVFVSDLPS